MSCKNNYLREKWRRLILDRQTSKLDVNTWCEEQGVTRDQYYYWLRTLRREAYESEISRLQAVNTNKELPASPFAEVAPVVSDVVNTQPSHPVPRESSAAATIRTGGIQIDIMDGISTELLQELLKVVRYV